MTKSGAGFHIGVVGAGRVGAVMAAGLRAAGHEIVAAAGESWTVTWRVTGPAKDYTMTSVLSRR